MRGPRTARHEGILSLLLIRKRLGNRLGHQILSATHLHNGTTRGITRRVPP